ncbi:hypothetical protein [Paenibacillus wynnii]|uniref:hypothetical protein n=1 Tax=Paenibacillus wynnii TaxID=268407 RepID=UPI00278EE15C|nr:hypothetical protein [Paenibacillus wynnii]MDQ0194976.1 hypothetical protein [Paenibacillus wynnii]
MLDDTPRKLLRILYHFSSHYKRMPTLSELGRLSGRSNIKIREGMQTLAEQNYIEWNRKMPVEKAVIIEDWERPDPSAKQQGEGQIHQQTRTTGNTDYWLYY